MNNIKLAKEKLIKYNSYLPVIVQRLFSLIDVQSFATLILKKKYKHTHSFGSRHFYIINFIFDFYRGRVCHLNDAFAEKKTHPNSICHQSLTTATAVDRWKKKGKKRKRKTRPRRQEENKKWDWDCGWK